MTNTSRIVDAHYNVARAKVSTLLIEETRNKRRYIALLSIYSICVILAGLANGFREPNPLGTAFILLATLILGWNIAAFIHQLGELSTIIKLLKKMQTSLSEAEFTQLGIELNTRGYVKLNEVI